jgi:hypothetical protein
VSAKHSGYKPESQQQSSPAHVEWSHVLVTVQDSGPGLDPEIVNRLFEAFYTTKPHGLGIGLTISRSIIEAHGGKLWAKANPPPGATFQFTLPIWRWSAWRGAAFELGQRFGDILCVARKAKYGVKQAAPGNYRTPGFAHRSVRRLFIRARYQQT